MRIILESVLMMLTEIYQNRSRLVESTACQSWRFLRHDVKRHYRTHVRYSHRINSPSEFHLSVFIGLGSK